MLWRYHRLVRRHRPWAIPAVAVIVMMAWAGAADARRVALVIGNDSYQSAAPLQNARSDAKAVARALERAGFAVTLKEDLTLKAMKEALRNFKEQISGGDEAVFYFSGHGVQFEGTNYLIPTDLVPQSEEQVADESVPLQRILDALRDQKSRFALAIVDACRDNPFKGSGRAIGGRGLAPVTAATGQMVLYSAGAGQEALDRLGPGDSDPNGVFTRVLIKEINKPGVPTDQMLKNVRDQVVRLARGVNHEQVPALYDQSIGEFYFVPTRLGESARAEPVDATDVATDASVSGGNAGSLEMYALLASARTAQAREKIERSLWLQLRHSLPNTLLYAWDGQYVEATPGVSRPAWGFEPATAESDGRTATVRVRHGGAKDGRLSFDDSDTRDYKVDCARHEFVPNRYIRGGSVTFLPEARRKAETFTASGADKLVEQVLCELPLRIAPLWALQDLDWTDLGGGWKSALRIRWSDPKRPNERYVFSRAELPKPNGDWSEIDFWWLVVNCTTNETRDTISLTATRSGEVIGLIGGTTWTRVKQNSPAANAYVLLCERP